jgi:hypothetical protein
MNEKKGFYNEKTGLILMLAGLAVFALAFIIMNPLGSGMGVSESPAANCFALHLCFCILSAIWRIFYVPDCKTS